MVYSDDKVQERFVDCGAYFVSIHCNCHRILHGLKVLVVAIIVSQKDNLGNELSINEILLSKLSMINL